MYSHLVPGTASVVVGGQFGSEAKGLVAAHLASNIKMPMRKLICTTNAGAQAGHTTVLDDGRKFVCYHLPTIGVLSLDSLIFLNAGSIIDLELLAAEVNSVCAVTGECPSSMWGRVVVHPLAAVISPKHKESEKTGSARAVGSTQKGVGEALVSKIRREPDSVVDHLVAAESGCEVRFGVFALDLNEELRRGHTAVSIEIPQGTGLSLNASPFFPHCTSRDCWVGQGLSDAGINPAWLGSVVMVCRTFPIRVGSNPSEDGKISGYSGDFYPDSKELSWEDFPGVEPERTTVTKRVRRIATWSSDQYRHSLGLNRPSVVYLTFTNYLYSLKENSKYERLDLVSLVVKMRHVERSLGLNPLHVYSWGPRVDQCSTDVRHAHEMSSGSGVV